MRPCSRCRRHVRAADRGCPFCGERLVEGTAPGAVGWAVGLALLGAACGPGKPKDETASEASSDGSSAGTASTTSTTSASATTGLPTSTSSSGSSGCDGVGCTDSSEAGGFIYGSPDGGTPAECDQWVQDCPMGQKCVPASLDGDTSFETLICAPVMENPAQTDEPCKAVGSGVSGIDNCDIGNICWSVDPDTLEGVCVAQCTGVPDNSQCGDPDAECALDAWGVLSLCLSLCHPLQQDCSEGKECVPDLNNASRFICIADQSGADGQVFDPCLKQGGCDPGLFCGNPVEADECVIRDTGCCLPFCDTSDPTCPGTGQQCVPWYEMGQAPPGFENVGSCRLP